MPNSKKSDSDYYRSNFDVYFRSEKSFTKYFGQYRDTVEILFENLESTGNPADGLSCSILYNMSHCLELGFKKNIIYFDKYHINTAKKSLHTHDLSQLFNDFKLVVNHVVENLKINYDVSIEDDDEKQTHDLMSVAKKIIEKLKDIDKNYIGFRYPVDKRGNSVFVEYRRENLLDIKILFDKTIFLLEFLPFVLSKYTDYVDDIEEMNREMYLEESNGQNSMF